MASKQSKTRAQDVNAAERRAFCLRLRRRGTNYRDIGAAVRLYITQPNAMFTAWPTYDERDAWKDVTKELRRVRTEAAEAADEIRELELERIDTALAKVMDAIDKKPEGDRGVATQMRAVAAMVKLIERRSKLLGLDAPVATELTGRNGGDLIVKIIRDDE